MAAMASRLLGAGGIVKLRGTGRARPLELMVRAGESGAFGSSVLVGAISGPVDSAA